MFHETIFVIVGCASWEVRSLFETAFGSTLTKFEARWCRT
jgi:hypothetical protein